MPELDNHLLSRLTSKEQQKILQKEKAVVQILDQQRKRLSQKYPLVFTMLASFGLVATFYGFEHIIDGIDILADNPIIMLVTGVLALAISGQLYKRLG